MTQVISIDTLNHAPKKAENYFTQEQMSIIKNMIAKNLNEDEYKMFIYMCMRHNLDPIAKQIYAVKRGNQMTIQTGIDGLRLIAERTSKYSPGKQTDYGYDEKGKLISATAHIKKKVGNEWHDVSATAFLSEYTGKNPMWDKMPHVMLEKCAESRAIRRAFPADTSGLYTDAEMEQTTQTVQNQESAKISPELCADIEKRLETQEELKNKILAFCDIKKIEDMTEIQLVSVKKFVEKMKEVKGETA